MTHDFKQVTALKTVPTLETTNTISLCGITAIKLICNIPAECDEKGAGGLWDLAGELAEIAGIARGLETPVYGEEYGQEQIYNRLREVAE